MEMEEEQSFCSSYGYRIYFYSIFLYFVLANGYVRWSPERNQTHLEAKNAHVQYNPSLTLQLYLPIYSIR